MIGSIGGTYLRAKCQIGRCNAIKIFLFIMRLPWQNNVKNSDLLKPKHYNWQSFEIRHKRICLCCISLMVYHKNVTFSVMSDRNNNMFYLFTIGHILQSSSALTQYLEKISIQSCAVRGFTVFFWIIYKRAVKNHVCFLRVAVSFSHI